MPLDQNVYFFQNFSEIYIPDFDILLFSFRIESASEHFRICNCHFLLLINILQIKETTFCFAFYKQLAMLYTKSKNITLYS